jgi:hypothetical protein
MTSLERRLARLEDRLRTEASPTFAERLRQALEQARQRRLQGLPPPEPPIVDPEVDPLGARLRWVWQWRRDGKAPSDPGPWPTPLRR